MIIKSIIFIDEIIDKLITFKNLGKFTASITLFSVTRAFYKPNIFSL